ncbi:MAG: rhamnogalacturonan acetylesterase [Sphingobacteriaceae bacterium]
MKTLFKTIGLLAILPLLAFQLAKKPVVIYLAGDSTVADYSLDEGYMEKKYPIMGWGQVFQDLFTKSNLAQVRNLIKTDTVLVVDKARGGRSTRTFFEEGRWAEIVRSLKKDDIVMIQFGHNDGAVEKTERYVTLTGYKEFLRLYVNQTREKGGIPILVTPVCRNYPWKEGKLSPSVHGEYPNAMREVAKELNVKLIDLTQISADAFTAKGQELVTNQYFMNFDKGLYVAYPDGQKDNTHFQPEGAKAVAQLVFNAMKTL